MKDGDHAGLAAFCSEPGAISVIQEKGRKYIIMTDRSVEKARIELNQNHIYLKVDCDFTTDDAVFSFSPDDKEWTRLGDKFHVIFSMKHFTGNKFAIFNYSTQKAGGYVDVDCLWLRIICSLLEICFSNDSSLFSNSNPVITTGGMYSFRLNSEGWKEIIPFTVPKYMTPFLSLYPDL